MDNSFIVKLGLNLQELIDGLNKAGHHMEGFHETVEEIGKSIAAAFALEKIGEFAFEISELAAKAHGVKNAFNEIPQATELLAQMRETVHGTVSDLDLMKDAIHAQNLNIPLQDLGTILEFVHERALATDGDFKSLADTLITAIGKGGMGAKKAMAALQISTEDYTKALKETGSVTEAVMQIAEREIGKTKGQMDETLLAIEGNAAAWANFKDRLGEVINKSGILAYVLTQVNNALTGMTQEDKLAPLKQNIDLLNQYITDGFEAQDGQMRVVEEQAKKLGVEIGKIYNANGNLYEVYLKQAEVKKDLEDHGKKELEQVKNIDYYTAEIKRLNEEKGSLIGDELTKTNQLIEADKKQLAILEQQGIAKEKKPGKYSQYDQARLETDPNTSFDPEKLASKVLLLSDAFKETKQSQEELFDAMGKDGPPAVEWLVKASADLIASQKKLQDEAEQTAHEIGKIGMAMARSANAAIDAHASFDEALKEIALRLIDTYEEIAIAAIIANAAKIPNYYLAIAGIVAGAALVHAAFANIGGSSGGSSASIAERGGVDYSSRTGGLNFVVSGKLTADGKDMSIVLGNQNVKRQRTG